MRQPRPVTMPCDAQAPSALRRVTVFGTLGLISAAAGCTVTLPPPSRGGASPAPEAAPLAGTDGLPMQSVALSVDGYKRDVATHIYRRCPDLLFDGAPPAILRSVVVLGVSVDAFGRPAAVGVVRSNGDVELDRLAMASVHRAAPLPQPARALTRAGRVEFVETWLFRDDGRFQIRSLAEVQQSEIG